jgi:DNA-binding transcriptional MocR family regulator
VDGIDLFLDEVAGAEHRDIQFVPKAERYDLTWGHPDPTLLPVDELRVAADAVLSHRGWQALSYGTSEGAGRLRHALAERLGRGTTADELVVTHGSSGALDLVLGLVSEPGDVVLVEQPTYFLALRIIADRRLRIVGLPPGAHLAPAVAEAATAHGGRTFLYVIPTHANPTGRTLGLDERRALVATAAEHDVTIVEDEVYAELGTEVLPSLADLDPERVVRLGSFSKTIAPGLRLGYVRTTAERAAALAGCGVLDSGGGINPFVAGIVADLMETGAYGRIVDRLGATYRERMAVLLGTIDDAHLPAGRPTAGFFAWIRAAQGDLVAAAADVGLAVAPASSFCVDRIAPTHARVSCSLLGPADLAEASARLASVLAGRGRTCGV